MKPIESPKQDKEHKTQVVIKGALGGIPIFGGTAGEVFNLIYKTGYEKRLIDWRVSVSYTINKILEDISIENLIENEEFQSLLTESSLIALKNHQKLKLDAIHNLLYNSIRLNANYDFSKLFLNYIDQFTDYHFKVLNFILENNNKDISIRENHLVFGQTLLNKVFDNDVELNEQIINDLEISKGIIIRKLDKKTKNNRTHMLMLSKLGTKFISFIKSYE